MRRAVFLAAVCGLMVSSAVAQDWAKEKLAKSSRHGEYVSIGAGNHKVDAFVAYPEVAHKATTVLVVYEIFGLTDWAKLACDEFAAAGYIAIALRLHCRRLRTSASRAAQDIEPARKAGHDGSRRGFRLRQALAVGER